MSLFDFRTHEVRELYWALAGPSLLAPQTLPIETDSDLRAITARHLSELRRLDEDPTDLFLYFSDHPSLSRLGRHFENLLEYFLTRLEKAPSFARNIQIQSESRGKKRGTLGELDLLFRAPWCQEARHWEASVKFYICVAREPEEFVDERHWLGTLVYDRLDRKIAKLKNRQLGLASTPEGARVIEERGHKGAESRALLKGFMYYDSEGDWRNAPVPASVSTAHCRGWWTTSRRPALPSTRPESRFMRLPPERWLAPFQGWLPSSLVYSRAEFARHIHDFFGGRALPHALTREIMSAEVEVLDEGANGLFVRELSRGNVVFEAWPDYARASAHGAEGSAGPLRNLYFNPGPDLV